MWHIVVAVLLGNEILGAWALPQKYANQYACIAQVNAFIAQWGPGNSLHQIGYRCLHEPLEA